MVDIGKLEEFRQEAEDFLALNDDWKQVVEKCREIKKPYGETFEHFLDNVCVGEECDFMGLQGKMLYGIGKLFPQVREVMPKNLGIFGFERTVYTCLLCGIDTTG